MEEIIRKSKREDLPALKELWSECFPDDTGYAHFFFENIFKEKCAVVFESGDEILGMIHVFPRTINTPCGKLSAKYIYGVGTKKSARGRGVAGKLIDSEAKDTDILVLIPANEGLFEFYRKKGFSEICEIAKVTLPPFGKTPVRKATEEDIPYMNSVYENALCESLYATRDFATWKLLLAEYASFGGGFSVFSGGYCAHYEKDGELIISEAFGENTDSIDFGREATYTTLGFGSKMAVIRPITERAREVLSVTQKRYINLMHN